MRKRDWALFHGWNFVAVASILGIGIAFPFLVLLIYVVGVFRHAESLTRSTMVWYRPDIFHWLCECKECQEWGKAVLREGAIRRFILDLSKHPQSTKEFRAQILVLSKDLNPGLFEEGPKHPHACEAASKPATS